MCGLRLANADPIVKAKKADAARRRMKDPAYRARLVAQVVAAGHAARARPEFRKRLSEMGRIAIRKAHTPEALAKRIAKRPEATRKRTETMIGWCPPQYRDEYRRLSRQGNLRAADARRIIEGKMTPFERKLNAVRLGAGIVVTPPAVRRGYDYTMGGVTAW